MPPSQNPAYEGEVAVTIKQLEEQQAELQRKIDETGRQLLLAKMRKRLEDVIRGLPTWDQRDLDRHGASVRFKTNLELLGRNGYPRDLTFHVLFVERRPDLALVLALILNSSHHKLIEGDPTSFLAFVIDKYPPGTISMKPALAVSLVETIQKTCHEDIKPLFNDCLEQFGAPVHALYSQVKVFRVKTFFLHPSAVLQELESRNIWNAGVVSRYIECEVQRSHGIVRATQRPGEDDLTIDLPVTGFRVILPGRSATSQEAKILGITTEYFYLQSLLAVLKDLRIKVSTAFERLIEEETHVHPYAVPAIVTETQLLPIHLPQGVFDLVLTYEIIKRALQLTRTIEGHFSYYHGL